MHNRSDQKVGQVAQRSPELVVEPLPAGVGCHLGRQAGQRPSSVLALWRSRAKMSLSWSMTPSMICRFPDAQRRSVFAHALLELFLGVAATSAP